MDQVKGLTLHQPWASAIAQGQKRFETRSWPTRYRGLVAIHAGKSTDHIDSEEDFPLGAIVAIAKIGQVYKTHKVVWPEDFTPGRRATEKTWGDWTVGRFAWRLDDVLAFSEPIPCRGFQGLWPVPPEVLRLIQAVGVRLKELLVETRPLIAWRKCPVCRRDIKARVCADAEGTVARILSAHGACPGSFRAVTL